MQAVQVNKETQQLYIGKEEDPIPKEGEILVRIHASGVNRADLSQKKGNYPPPKGESEILGLEMAGVIEELGEGVTDLRIGDRVCALLPGGGYAEKVTIPSSMAMKIPNEFSFEEAAAIPEVYLTAYLNIIKLAELKKDEFVLIHAGASGVGTAAIQLARVIGAKSIVTAGTDEKLEVCKSLGANYTVNYKKESFSDRVHEITNGKGVNVIIDFVGSSYWEKNLKSIATDGRWIIVAVMGGTHVEVNLKALMAKRILLKGSTLRTKSKEDKISLTKEFYSFSIEKFLKKELIPVIDTVFDWEDANKAHDYVENNKNIGKVILKIH
ncbi:NAD(P)H-quinone oxidoreductase [Oceanobacillus sp. CF4.6]|uniref:NAD(P)H-quinone oxidoreductase n=1 Tax=Oceanobacillus sp. CF4.6 TaxID=3373080 RepID=UPI003EE4D0A4